jgi:hypothetical protein
MLVLQSNLIVKFPVEILSEEVSFVVLAPHQCRVQSIKSGRQTQVSQKSRIFRFEPVSVVNQKLVSWSNFSFSFIIFYQNDPKISSEIGISTILERSC